MVVDIDTLKMIRDCSEANVSPIIRVELSGKMYDLSEEEYVIDEDGDIIFKLDRIRWLEWTRKN